MVKLRTAAMGVGFCVAVPVLAVACVAAWPFAWWFDGLLKRVRAVRAWGRRVF